MPREPCSGALKNGGRFLSYSGVKYETEEEEEVEVAQISGCLGTPFGDVYVILAGCFDKEKGLV